ncbi:fibronectin type III domain-containing protein [Micromonospora rifamycinica]|uniref:Fibronectin type III domain-containing protein n=1 Tax=Micromonospora rifamycinica TaxID=291594 RepID=A0A1C5IFN7_9ACTN|nr:cellulose binding domain-containing protein [Micromonospora rifamycinica]SCG56839.1 Fibronectin type III domain-containing protein [Micromonospora rifamycinica]
MMGYGPGSLFRRMWPAVVAVATLPASVLGFGLVTTPAAGADTVSMLASTAPPSPPSSTPAPPAPPTLLRATTVTSTSVTLTWTAAVPGCCAITNYTIMYPEAFSDVIPTTTVGNVTTATITISPTRQYQIRVAARDSVGHTSPWSNQIIVVAPATDDGPDTVPPGSPTSLTNRNGTLYWSAASDNVGVTGYQVYRYDGWYTSTLLGTATSTTYQLPPSATTGPGPRIQFYVRARDAAGNLSAASNTVDATSSTPPADLPPTAPRDLSVSRITSTSATLTWTAAEPGCCDITGYTISYFPAFHDLGETARVGNVTTATITLKPATQYRVIVQASDSGGHGSPSSDPLTIVTPATDTGPDTVPPGAPGTLTVSDVTTASATLNWTPATDNVGVTGYQVYRWDGSFNSTLVATVPGTSHTLSLAPSVPNRYYVRARDAAGNVSIATNEVRVDPPTGPTTSPPGPTCAVTYQKQAEWPGGFVTNVTIGNTATTTVDGWTLAFTFPGDQRITTLWSATYTQSGSAVTIRNAGWNGTIAAGASVSFGFQGTWSGSNASPTAFSLNGAPCR